MIAQDVMPTRIVRRVLVVDDCTDSREAGDSHRDAGVCGAHRRRRSGSIGCRGLVLPDVIFLDIGMPDSTAIKCARNCEREPKGLMSGFMR